MVTNSGLQHSDNYEDTRKKSKLVLYIEHSLVARRVLLFVAMLGMCMLIGDGILTPAISGFHRGF